MNIFRLIFLSIIFTSSAWAENYSIGVLAYDGKQQALNRWQPTADYLSSNIEKAHFSIIPLTHEEFEHAINKGELEFILTNPGHYVRLELKFGITRIATFLTQYRDTSLKQFSSVIFTRSDSGLEKAIDLPGKTLAAVNEQAFGGFQLVQDMLLNEGVDVLTDMHIKWMGFPHSDVVMAVIDGLADVGTVRSGILEKMAHKQLIDLQDIRIINEKNHDGFPLLHSVDLYPEWPFSKLPETDTELSKKVAISLYQMTANHKAAEKSGGAGWTTPLNYASIHEVLKRLSVNPYQVQPVKLDTLIKAYRGWLISLLIAFIAMAAGLIRLFYNNRKLSKEQQSLHQHQLQLEESVEQRTDELLQTNQTLQIEIASHAQTEQIMRHGCESLQSLYGIFTRNDLDRQQKLISVVEAVRQYLGTEVAMLSSIQSGQYNVTCISPSTTELSAPLSFKLAQQACEENQVLVRENNEDWARYLASPVIIEGNLYCLFEFASSRDYEDERGFDRETLTSELSLNILNLITLWVSNEALSLHKQKQSLQKNEDAQLRFDQLSPRENQVLGLLIKGESTKVMARTLNISTKTIEMHRANLLRKTQAKSSTELVQLAVNSGLF